MQKSDIFISYIEENGSIAKAIAAGLEARGYRTWYYERDSIPGVSYLLQTPHAIQGSKCFLFLVSQQSMTKHRQVDRELVIAHEAGKHIVPLLLGTSFEKLKAIRPEWRFAVGAAVGLEVTSESISLFLPRLLRGLETLGVQPGSNDSRQDSEVDEAGDTHSEIKEGDALEVEFSDIESVGTMDSSPMNSSVWCQARVVDEHPQVGFLADAIITDAKVEREGTIRMSIMHSLLKPNPYTVQFRCVRKLEALNYFRFSKLIHGYPLVLRLYCPFMLPGWSTLQTAIKNPIRSIVATQKAATGVTSLDAVGVSVKGKFVEVMPIGTRLPFIAHKNIRTAREGQNTLSITAAVRKHGDRTEFFPKLVLPVPIAPKGVVWMQATFRVDPDGRVTVLARDPLKEMRVKDLMVVQ